MLRRFLIQDYILIERAEFGPGEGLCVFTGETGAGKSMVLGALAVLVGEKFPTGPVRPGARKAIIEGEFDFARGSEILAQSDIEDSGGTVLLRREVAEGGRARCFVNDQPVALEILQAVGEHLVDLHGQHEQQALLKRARHLDFFDAYADTLALRSEVAYLYREHNRRRVHLGELERLQEEHRQREGLLRFQLEEIDRLRLREGEEDELESELRRLEGAEQLAEITHAAWQALSDGEPAAQSLLRRAREVLSSGQKIDPELRRLAEEIAAAEAQIAELGKLARDRHLGVTFDPERLEVLRERRSALAGLMRKYGLSAAELLRKADEWRQALSDTDALEADLARARSEVKEAEVALRAKATDLSEKRLKKKDAFERDVRKHLTTLGLSGARFEVSWETAESRQVDTMSAKGYDKVEFLFSADPGREARPLVDVASGGEASRIMLALKRVFAGKLEPMTLVFDEIDIGISGRMAERVGDALLELAGRHQVLAITHLPQIASRGHTHFAIVKRVSDGETVTEVQQLAAPERVQELALLLGGTKVTPKVVATAQELLRRGQEAHPSA